MKNRGEKFAWYPIHVHRNHEEPPEADPLVKAFYNGWVGDGWVFWKRVRWVKNFSGQKFYVRLA